MVRMSQRANPSRLKFHTTQEIGSLLSENEGIAINSYNRQGLPCMRIEGCL